VTAAGTTWTFTRKLVPAAAGNILPITRVRAFVLAPCVMFPFLMLLLVLVALDACVHAATALASQLVFEAGWTNFAVVSQDKDVFSIWAYCDPSKAPSPQLAFHSA
jgi:hypothetical protein